MAGSMNKVILIGHLGADPELRYTQGGQPVATLRLATNEIWTGKDGQRQERVEWHRVTLWGAQAENTAKYMTKGGQLVIEGRLQTREWLDKEGNKRYTTEVVAQQVTFLGGGKQRSEGTRPEGNFTQNRAPASSAGSDMPFDYGTPPMSEGEDDVPF